MSMKHYQILALCALKRLALLNRCAESIKNAASKQLTLRHNVVVLLSRACARVPKMHTL